MLTTAHLLTGAAVGKITGNTYLTIPIAFLLHYFLDAIPHWNQKPVLGYKEAGFKGSNKTDLIVKALEPALGLILTAYLIFGLNQTLISALVFGAFFGWFPDLLVFLRWKYGLRLPRPIAYFEANLHKHTTYKKGIFWQIIVCGIAIYILTA